MADATPRYGWNIPVEYDRDWYQEFVSLMGQIDDQLYAVQVSVPASADLTDILNDIAALQSDVSALQSDVTALQSSLSSCESDISALQSALSSCESDISTLQSNLTTLEASVTAIWNFLGGSTGTNWPANIKVYGAAGNGSDDDRSAVSSADDTGRTLVFPSGTYKIASNLTISSPCIFLNGAKVAPSSGVTVTFNNLVSGAGEIFDYSSGGLVVLSRKISRVYPEWFGANYVDDAAVAFQRSVTAMTAGILDLNNRQFRIDSTVMLDSEITIEGYGGSIDFSNAASGDYLFEAAGSSGTARSLNSNVSAGDNSCDITNATSYFSANQWVILKDTNDWGANSIMGEWLLIKSVAGTTVTFADELLYAYYTAQSAQLVPITWVSDVVIRGVKAIGGGTDSQHRFIQGYYVDGLQIYDCEAVDINNRAVGLEQVLHFNMHDNIVRRSNSNLGYGISTTACSFGVIKDNHFEYCRHAVAIGGAYFPNRWITVSGNTVISMTDAGLDTHDAAEHIIFDGNTVVNGEADTTGDGIITQGAKVTITNNQIENCTRHGVLVQCQVLNAQVQRSFTIANNSIFRPTSEGIRVTQAVSGADLDGVTITGNLIHTPSGGEGIAVDAGDADIENIIITSNNIIWVTGSHNCILVSADTGRTIYRLIINSNICRRGDDNDNNIEVSAADSNGITQITINCNVLQNGTYGIYTSNTDNIVVLGNYIGSTATGDTSIDGANKVVEHNL